ncbi:MAG: DNA repair protein RecO [Patescibacteria group bacterium]
MWGMKEYLTQAIVLGVRPIKESDKLADLYTRDLGRIEARIIGGQKILSKLAQHLDLLNLVTVRLIEKNNFTVADIMSEEIFLGVKKDIESYRKARGVFSLIRSLLPKGVEDERLWQGLLRALRENNFNSGLFLKLLGYDPVSASCFQCSSKKVNHFFLRDQSFLCSLCHKNLSNDEKISLN